MSMAVLTPVGAKLTFSKPATGAAPGAVFPYGTSGRSVRTAPIRARNTKPVDVVGPPQNRGKAISTGQQPRVKNMNAGQHVRHASVHAAQPHMARLSMSQRRSLKPSDYVFPERAPGHGSYPIPDHAHAHAALLDSAGKPEHHAVRRAVCAKFSMGCGTPEAQPASPGV